MPTIRIETIITGEIQTCFDLSRSIELHVESTKQTKERAIAGKTSGLLELGETVTWEATHFGIRQQLTSKITAFESPTYFRDEQVKGIFKKFEHDHHFYQKGVQVIMTDVLYFESPLGLLGKLFNKLILTNYLKRFLMERNKLIKLKIEMVN
ncbi:MAG: SRPBCC family protein [Fluviicola sp.]|jgi:ligand-binding SRPBCC domain-containing protein